MIFGDLIATLAVLRVACDKCDREVAKPINGRWCVFVRIRDI